MTEFDIAMEELRKRVFILLEQTLNHLGIIRFMDYIENKLTHYSNHK